MPNLRSDVNSGQFTCSLQFASLLVDNKLSDT
jgi:hypothetical protein